MHVGSGPIHSSADDPFRELWCYEKIISSTPNLMALVDRYYQFRMVNDAFCQAFAKDREEILGKRVADLIGSDPFRDVVKKPMDLAFAGDIQNHEQWFTLPTMGHRFLAMTFHPIWENGGKVDNISMEIRDITAFKQAESDRQRLFDASPDMLGVAGFDGYLKELNPSWTKTLGWSPEELKDKPYQILIHPDDREATIEAEERLLLRLRISGFENRLLCKDDSYRWISWSSVADIKRKEFFLVGRDVTENKKLAENLLFSEKKYRTIFDCAGDALFVHDFAGKFLDVNQVAVEILGYSREALLSRSLSDIVISDSPSAIFEVLNRIETTGDASFETRHVCADGTERHVWINSRKIDYGEQPAILSVARDISERKQMEEKLRTLATLDPLTEVNNRRHFMESAHKEMLRSRRYSSPLPVLILDIDHFKSINDTYGHDIGDKFLKTVADRCLATLRATDIFARLGGEEFAALLPQTDEEGARLTAERLRKALGRLSVSTTGGPISLTVSIGFAMAHPDDPSVDAVLKRADLALYEAKSQGRNRVIMG